VGQFDAAQLDVIPPERKRSIRDLGFHVFRVGLSFIDTMDQGRMPDTWFEERAPEGMRDGGDVARWGALVRGRITGWFEGARDDEFERVLEIYYGPRAPTTCSSARPGTAPSTCASSTSSPSAWA